MIAMFMLRENIWTFQTERRTIFYLVWKARNINFDKSDA